jgi:hypothetical protein
MTLRIILFFVIISLAACAADRESTGPELQQTEAEVKEAQKA